VSSLHHFAASVCVLLAASIAQPANAQQSDSARAPAVRGARFTGQINNLTTTRPVTTADVRLMWVDSAHTEKDASGKESSELFIDSTRSRVGITNDSGAFAINNVLAGHYVINVRRIGFEPVEALLTMGTSMIEMELAMTQLLPMLPEVKITASTVNRVSERLDRVGFVTRSRMGASGQLFFDRARILKSRPTYITDLLERYGIDQNAIFTLDRMETDWDNLRSYPVDLVIGIEIYRRRGSVPTEFDQTRGGSLAFGPGGSGGVSQATVIIWTYIPY
jgi:hypothetical protein